MNTRRSLLAWFRGPRPEEKAFSLEAFYARREVPTEFPTFALRAGLPTVETAPPFAVDVRTQTVDPKTLAPELAGTKAPR